MVVTNEIVGTFDQSSYNTSPYVFPYLEQYFVNMYPQYTNGLVSISRGGASWENQFTQQQQSRGLTVWANEFYTNHVIPYDFMLANDNGSYDTPTVVQWGTNLFGAPPLFWNGTAKTNEGLPFPVVHIATGANEAPATDGDNGSLARNAGAIQLNQLFSLPDLDTWHDTFTNGLNSNLTDQTGAHWFYALGHLTQQYHYALTLATIRGLGLETNVGSITFNWSDGSIVSSNQFAAVNLTKTSSQVSYTLRALRMPPSGDVIASTSNNVSTTLYASMPTYGSIMQWVIQFTNLNSTTTYSAYLDGVLWDRATGAQWNAGRNEATNTPVNLAFTQQQTKIIYDICDKYGVDHVTRLQTHTAGENGVNGPDLINYTSNAGGSFPSHTGASLVQTLSPFYQSLRNNYDVVTHNDAQQTNHTFLLVQDAAFIPAPFR